MLEVQLHAAERRQMSEEVVTKAVKRLCPIPRGELIDCWLLQVGWKLKYRYDDSIRVVVDIIREEGKVMFVQLHGIHKNKDGEYSHQTKLTPSAIRKEYMYYNPAAGEVGARAYQANAQQSELLPAKQNADNNSLVLNPITVKPAFKVEATQTGRFPVSDAADDGPQKKVNKQLTDTSQINRTQERLSYVLNILSEQVMPQLNWIVGELNKQAQFRLALKEAAVTFLKNVEVK